MNINDSSSNLFQFEKFCSTDEGFCLLKAEFEKMALSNKLVFKLIELHLTAKACKKRIFGEDLDSLVGIYKRCNMFRPSVITFAVFLILFCAPPVYVLIEVSGTF